MGPAQRGVAQELSMSSRPGLPAEMKKPSGGSKTPGSSGKGAGAGGAVLKGQQKISSFFAAKPAASPAAPANAAAPLAGAQGP